MWKRYTVIDLRDYVTVPSFEVTTDFRKGDTQDIISVVVKDDKEAKQLAATRRLAKLLEQSDEYETCRKIYDNVKHNVEYVEDESGLEIVKFPHALLYFKKGDCKSLSVCIADLLRGVHGGKIRCEYWFVSQDYFDPTPKHVFPVAILSDGTEIVLDTVYYYFDVAPPFWHKIVKKAA
jgi:Transglutaminase-like superfamily